MKVTRARKMSDFWLPSKSKNANLELKIETTSFELRKLRYTLSEAEERLFVCQKQERAIIQNMIVLTDPDVPVVKLEAFKHLKTTLPFIRNEIKRLRHDINYLRQQVKTKAGYLSELKCQLDNSHDNYILEFPNGEKRY